MMNALVSFAPSCRSDRVSGRHTLICRGIVQETHDVKTFVFCPKRGQAGQFKAGQFITLNLVIHGAPAVRTYSISSPPTRVGDLRITVKRVPGGLASNWLHDNLEQGSEIEIDGPSGSFNWDDLRSDRPLFLSGGSGITPVMSMLRTLADSGSDKDVCFIHSARSPKDIIFGDELDNLARDHRNFHVHVVCAEAVHNWAGPTGLVGGSMLLKFAPDIRERTVYACGPEPYMNAVRNALNSIGLDPGRYHEESFGGLLKPAPVLQTAQAASVRFARTGVTHQCRSTQTLLEIARSVGLYLPSACQQGICGTCRVLKVSGDVEMADFGGLSAQEKDAGYVLACCTHPMGAVSIDL
ncbi:hybrid-cluster NAD(P)-dependent oxidoreductase [Mesorhizobium sp. B263B1A]|uniref:hybrid-cluster NAD(P)-dependent oxidoreductase n=2 Tax=Mesorhizobium TaxID=68287 RepID=UPI00112D21E2|nr:hybrid-cluster NAD(P)-dependent oxidoreductase [Mesorhizobium sp. B263B1A]MCA0025703.1 hybrid-cluster NAD(P)-dependent oxidoreductase [Mesorhizobium sp. B263B1A]TPJ92405.1 hybrid-cluster NAD(P)-dependent oxidoreductase [Mesorhizobium sp. B2-5-12]TPK21196.1 hybrid-cluster NAD(P)-dependent oxidoreductase [Mesorhizobium sp. B2-5-6]